jgi:hypothetical protein
MSGLVKQRIGPAAIPAPNPLSTALWTSSIGHPGAFTLINTLCCCPGSKRTSSLAPNLRCVGVRQPVPQPPSLSDRLADWLAADAIHEVRPHPRKALRRYLRARRRTVKGTKSGGGKSAIRLPYSGRLRSSRCRGQRNSVRLARYHACPSTARRRMGGVMGIWAPPGCGGCGRRRPNAGLGQRTCLEGGALWLTIHKRPPK